MIGILNPQDKFSTSHIQNKKYTIPALQPWALRAIVREIILKGDFN